MAKKTAFGYVRVSGPSQFEGDGLVRQKLTIKEYAHAHGITIVNIFREGKCEGRKSYQETAPEVISLIRRLRRKRKGQKRMTFNHVADVLNEKGYKTANGKEFKGNNVSTLMHRLK